MNHKTDMHEALHLCIDAMLHDGVPTDPEHPKRIALNAAEAALASRPDASKSPNRASDEPGGQECMKCGRVFIGGPEHDECGLCVASRPDAQADEVRAADPGEELQGWSVTVERNGVRLLTIEKECVAGVENIGDFAPLVRDCAEHLLSFIGRDAQADERGAPSGYKLVPIDPTIEMCAAMRAKIAAGWSDSVVWAAALDAATSPDCEQVGEAYPSPAVSHCQNGGDVCLAGNRDGVCCPEDSCDIDDGVRKAPISSDDLDRLLIALGLEPRTYRRSDGHLLVGAILSALAKKHAADASPSRECGERQLSDEQRRDFDNLTKQLLEAQQSFEIRLRALLANGE